MCGTPTVFFVCLRCSQQNGWKDVAESAGFLFIRRIWRRFPRVLTGWKVIALKRALTKTQYRHGSMSLVCQDSDCLPRKSMNAVTAADVGTSLFQQTTLLAWRSGWSLFYPSFHIYCSSLINPWSRIIPVPDIRKPFFGYSRFPGVMTSKIQWHLLIQRSFWCKTSS